MIITFGIDPGLGGALAVLRGGGFLAVGDMPLLAKGSGSVKSEVNAAAVFSFLREHCSADSAGAVALERVNAMPGQGVSSVFSLGDSFGCVRGVVACTRLETHYVAPATWKKHFKLGTDKEMSRALAQRLFPDAPLHLKKHEGRAEALLLARWLYESRYGD